MTRWEVESTDRFDDWYQKLSRKEQESVMGRVQLLRVEGPTLGRPAVERVHQSRHANMKELRAERGIRVLFAFDPRRNAILLIGGDKSPRDQGSPNWNAWYARHVPLADDLYDAHLAQLREEGLI